VRLLIVNRNDWHLDKSWPPAEVEYREFFLVSGGKANTPAGDGRLIADEPVADGSDGFDYDPTDPVMSVRNPQGHDSPCDQRLLDHRRDVLVYQTEPLERDITVVGPVRAVIWASSDCTDTDFTVTLVDVGPDGMAINLSYGIVRAKYRFGFDRSAPLMPSEPTEFAIRMRPAGVLFRRGSRIRLDISSSDFPGFDRNHNTGRDFWSDPDFKIAHQTVFHGRARPSRLILPVLPT
jgi:putative CocE/NonD family hydrolase